MPYIYSNFSFNSLVMFLVKGEMTVCALYAEFSGDQNTAFKPQVPFCLYQRNTWMQCEVSDIKIFQ